MTALLGLAARLRLARLYLVTDARSRQGDLADFLAAALAGGVDVVRLVPAAPGEGVPRDALAVARQLASVHQAVVGVGGTPVLPREVPPDLLHLDAAGGSAATARSGLHPAALLGRSAHGPDQVDAALADAAVDYLTVGPVHGRRADGTRAAPRLDLVRHAADAAPAFASTSRPWFAAGGIAGDTLAGVLEAGARRVCVSRALTAATDPQAAAAVLSRALADAWRADPAAERYVFAAATAGGLRTDDGRRRRPGR